MWIYYWYYSFISNHTNYQEKTQGNKNDIKKTNFNYKYVKNTKYSINHNKKNELMNTDKDYSDSVKAKPFIGQDYGKNNIRMMLLGESHYCNDPEEYRENITQEVIEDLYDPNSEHEPYKNTYIKAMNASEGRKLETPQEKKNFLPKPLFIILSKLLFQDRESLQQRNN